MTQIDFDANEVEPMGSFEPLPVGEYQVVISSSERKPNSKGTGEFLQLVYDVIEGEFQGRKLFDRLNIINESEQAQKIARSALSSICRSIGVMKPTDTEELHDKPFVVRVAIRPAKGEYQASNVIKEYKSLEPHEEKVEKPADKPAEKSASETKKRPWEKEKKK